MKFFQVDVFSDRQFAGNGLTVVFPDRELTNEKMQNIACEFKQFETIFLWQRDEAVFQAKIYTVEEELDFAGHPILGAAAVIHQEFFPHEPEKEISIMLNQKSVKADSGRSANHFEVVMNQGVPEWIGAVDESDRQKYCEALHLSLENLCEEYPMEVVSTGLPYLIVPIRSGLEHCQIMTSDFEKLLAENHAKFVYVFDFAKREGRTWDNFGKVEDVATGSAAGPMGAYLYKYRCYEQEKSIDIHQGRFVGRPSILKVFRNKSGEILVAGDVTMVAEGKILLD